MNSGVCTPNYSQLPSSVAFVPGLQVRQRCRECSSRNCNPKNRPERLGHTEVMKAEWRRSKPHPSDLRRSHLCLCRPSFLSAFQGAYRKVGRNRFHNVRSSGCLKLCGKVAIDIGVRQLPSREQRSVPRFPILVSSEHARWLQVLAAHHRPRPSCLRTRRLHTNSLVERDTSVRHVIAPWKSS